MRLLTFATLLSLSVNCNLPEIERGTYDFSLEQVNGDNQDQLIANEESEPFVIKVTQGGIPAKGVKVRFEVVEGAATIGGAEYQEVISDEDGLTSQSVLMGAEFFTNVVVEVTVNNLLGSSEDTLFFVASSDRFRDERDSQVYEVVQVEEKMWMKSNLNYAGSGVCYDNLTSNCDQYGRLYTWSEVTQKSINDVFTEPIRGICPLGWRLPSNTDFEGLITLYGLYNLMCCPELWESSFLNENLINNASGFSIKPSGIFYSSGAGQFQGEKLVAFFWTSSKYNQFAYRYLLGTDDGLYHGVNLLEFIDDKYSCRCIKE
ncbi:MAG: FISUMP domain-containing protein [Saprospiraceae bacterium]